MLVIASTLAATTGTTVFNGSHSRTGTPKEIPKVSRAASLQTKAETTKAGAIVRMVAKLLLESPGHCPQSSSGLKAGCTLRSKNARRMRRRNRKNMQEAVNESVAQSIGNALGNLLSPGKDRKEKSSKAASSAASGSRGYVAGGMAQLHKLLGGGQDQNVQADKRSGGRQSDPGRSSGRRKRSRSSSQGSEYSISTELIEDSEHKDPKWLLRLKAQQRSHHRRSTGACSGSSQRISNADRDNRDRDRDRDRDQQTARRQPGRVSRGTSSAANTSGPRMLPEEEPQQSKKDDKCAEGKNSDGWESDMR